MTFLRSLLNPCRLACALAAFWLSCAATAAPVSYAFAGTVSDDDAGRGYEAFSGSFTFDSAAIDGIGNGTTAAYAHAGSPWGISVSFDGGSLYSYGAAFNVLVTNDLVVMDQFGVLGQQGGDSLGLTLTDYTQAVFNSVALPSSALSLASFWAGDLAWEAEGARLTGRLTHLECTVGCTTDPVTPGTPGTPAMPLPTPGTLPLVSCGLLALAAVLRRRLDRR